MAAIEINAENFEEKVIRSDKPVLIDFWAVWCGPCSMMSPIIEQIGEELADKLIVGKVNCDENMELAQQYKVAGIPAFFLFKGGEEIRKGDAVRKSDIPYFYAFFVFFPVKKAIPNIIAKRQQAKIIQPIHIAVPLSLNVS